MSLYTAKFNDNSKDKENQLNAVFTLYNNLIAVYIAVNNWTDAYRFGKLLIDRQQEGYFKNLKDESINKLYLRMNSICKNMGNLEEQKV